MNFDLHPCAIYSSFNVFHNGNCSKKTNLKICIKKKNTNHYINIRLTYIFIVEYVMLFTNIYRDRQFF